MKLFIDSFCHQFAARPMLAKTPIAWNPVGEGLIF
jgi:hypothetical protein